MEEGSKPSREDGKETHARNLHLSRGWPGTGEDPSVGSHSLANPLPPPGLLWRPGQRRGSAISQHSLTSSTSSKERPCGMGSLPLAQISKGCLGLTGPSVPLHSGLRLLSRTPNRCSETLLSWSLTLAQHIPPVNSQLILPHCNPCSFESPLVTALGFQPRLA